LLGKWAESRFNIGAKMEYWTSEGGA
jgi:hypothetical protein